MWASKKRRTLPVTTFRWNTLRTEATHQETTMSMRTHPTTPDTIVLINGLWMTALSWEHWVKRYSDRGYRVIARSWPGMDGDIEELRRDPSDIAGLGLTKIVEHYEGI